LQEDIIQQKLPFTCVGITFLLLIKKIVSILRNGSRVAKQVVVNSLYKIRGI
jgi:hypothetical protein